jgi:hypothetical protein
MLLIIICPKIIKHLFREHIIECYVYHRGH